MARRLSKLDKRILKELNQSLLKNLKSKKKKRKIKEYRLPLDTPIKTRFEVNDDEFIQFRDRFGRIRRNPPGSLRVFAEIRKRKSRKLVAYANYVKAGKVEPRRFTTSYRRYLETRRVSPGKFRETQKRFEFSLNTSETILSQIKSASREACEAIVAEAKENDFCVFRMKLHTSLGTPITDTLSIRKGTKINDVAYIIASAIISRINDTNMRMSPKALANAPKKLHIRSIQVELEILDAAKFGG